MIRSIFLTVMLLGAPLVRGQQADSENIALAIRQGNAKQLALHFTGSIDLTVDKVEEVYSKEQAEIIVSRFFAEHVPKSFSIRHEGRSKIDDHFYIGDLKTDGQDFRVTYFLKKEGNAYKVRQLRIERE